jgi:hypothetical protein
MKKTLSFKVLGFTSFNTLSAIREIDVFFSTPYDDFEGEVPSTLVIFSLRGSGKNNNQVISDIGSFFAYVFTLAGISADKFPQLLRVDDDNHTVELSRNGDWKDNDYQNLCILMEAISSIFGWTFRYNEHKPTAMNTLFGKSLQS